LMFVTFAGRYVSGHWGELTEPRERRLRCRR
jgi:hypothetical protein